MVAIYKQTKEKIETTSKEFKSKLEELVEVGKSEYYLELDRDKNLSGSLEEAQTLGLFELMEEAIGILQRIHEEDY